MIKRIFLIIVLFIVGCSQTNRSQYIDVRQRMYDAISNDEEYNNRGVKLVRLDHIGEVMIEGQEYHVAYVGCVLTDMRCPKGKNQIVFFDDNFQYSKNDNIWGLFGVGKVLWCDGSRIYFDKTNHLGGYMTGSVLEFKKNCYNGKYELMIENTDGTLISGSCDPDAK